MAHRGKIRRDNFPYRADGDPNFHALGNGISRKARPHEPEAAWHRRRADQSGSLGLVSQIYRRRTLSGYGYLVADRNRPSVDHTFAGTDETQTRLCDVAVSGHRSRYRRRAGKIRPQRWRRLSGSNQALAGNDAHHLRRSGSFRADLLEPIPGQVLCGDGAKRDKEGYFWLLGRVDDVMNVAGHRIS